MSFLVEKLGEVLIPKGLDTQRDILKELEPRKRLKAPGRKTSLNTEYRTARFY